MHYRREGISYYEGDAITPSNAFKTTVEEYAEDVARELGFAVGDDLSEAVERLGGRIHYEEMDELLDEAGSIFVHAASDFDILLPEYTSPKRDRFTIAHELGHYFLHSDQGEIPIIAYRQGSTRLEWEANWFAASLLMPNDQFRIAFHELRGNLTLVAHRFGVSEDAARVRKDRLNA